MLSAAMIRLVFAQYIYFEQVGQKLPTHSLYIQGMLEQRIKDKGMDPSALGAYVESFRHGVYPHAGAGIGLDRVVFLYLGLDNVRKASMFPRDPNRCTP